MPSIDFYIIPAQGNQARLLFACRLLEKAYQQQHKIFVFVESRDKAQTLDSLLWTFRDDSFIPHQLQRGTTEVNPAPIQIGYPSILLTPSSTELSVGAGNDNIAKASSGPDGQIIGQHRDILLNMDSEIPAFHHQFNRILEIFTSESNFQEIAQKHRVFYEEKGYKITTHNLIK